jgi:glutathione S-transferase
LLQDPTAGLLFREAIIRAQNGGIINEAAVNVAKVAFANKMDGYERILAKHEFLAGPNITLVDLFHLPVGAKLVTGGFGEALTDEKARPHVAK